MDEKIKFNEKMVGKTITVAPDYWEGEVISVVDEETLEVRRKDGGFISNVSIFDVRQ